MMLFKGSQRLVNGALPATFNNIQTHFGLISRTYASQRLSKSVSKAGKGRTLVARSKKPMSMFKRREASFKQKTPAVQPTTLDMGNFAKLQSVPVEDRTIHRNLLEKVSSFKELRIADEIRDNISASLITDTEVKGPTAVQKLAIKALRNSRKEPTAFQPWLIAAETGSGKTLAYLAPVLSNILEMGTPEPGPRVSGIVLVPTLELISQVAEAARKLVPNLNVVSMDGTTTNNKLSKQIVNGADLIVATPDKLTSLFKHYDSLKDRALAECRYIVVDEADSLMNESFAPSTLAAINLAPQIVDLIFCTATIPRFFEKELRKTYPDATRLVTPSLHRLPRHIEFRVIEVFKQPYRDNKDLALQQALYSIYHDNSEMNLTKRVVVFVNKRGQIAPLVAMLNKNGYPALGMDGKLEPEARKQLLEDFVQPAKQMASENDKLKVLVATDLVARGIDMKRIRNVILYDLPWSSADLLHRAGRTGRLNAKGRVILLVSRKESKGWVRGLETIVKKGQALA